MNIFFLHRDPEQAAKEHVDKHVVKMIVEYAQLLSTAQRMLDGVEWIDYGKNNRKIKRYKLENPNADKIIYKACHYNHPSAVWVRESKLHYQWLYRLFKKLGHEYTHRYGKVHSTNMKLNHILERVPNTIGEGWREPPPAMQHYPQCIVPGDSIQSYRNYYIEAKAYFAKWSKRDMPDWFAEGVA